MDPSTIKRGLTSLHWFLAAHSDELSEDILCALGEGPEFHDRGDSDLISRIRELSESHLGQLCTAIQSVHRSYFGTMNGRELSSFLHHVVEEGSIAQHS